jgi:hypothetical protein
VTAPIGTSAGTALETCSGTAAVTAPAGTMAATALETMLGTGNVAGPVGLVDASGGEGIVGTGASIAPAGLIAGFETLPSIDGTGDIATVGTCSGSGTIFVPADQLGGGGGGGYVGRTYVNRPAPFVAIVGTGGMAAQVGAMRGRGAVSTDRIDREEAYLLGLLELEEVA